MLNKKSDPALVILTISDLHGQLEPTYSWIGSVATKSNFALAYAISRRYFRR